MNTVRHRNQLAPAMRTNIVERFERFCAIALSHAHDDHRFLGDVVGNPISDVWEILQPFDHLPHLGPQQLLLGSKIFAAEKGVEWIGRQHLGVHICGGDYFGHTILLNLITSPLLFRGGATRLRNMLPSCSGVGPLVRAEP